MLTSEFYERTGYQPTCEEWADIECSYMSSKANKDTFCRAWVVINREKVEAAKRMRKKYAEREKMQEFVCASVLRFVRARGRHCEQSGAGFWTTATDNLRKVLGKYYKDAEACEYIRKIYEMEGITRGFETSQAWDNYWHLHGAVVYGL